MGDPHRVTGPYEKLPIPANLEMVRITLLVADNSTLRQDRKWPTARRGGARGAPAGRAGPPPTRSLTIYPVSALN